MDRRRVLGLGLTASASLLMSRAGVRAQGKFPERPLRLVVPYPAGGPFDYIARIYVRLFAEQIGQTVVIENKPGGDAAIGSADVAHAKPDGYSLLLGASSTHITAPALTDKPLYDPLKNFAQLAVTGTYTLCIAVNKDVPAANLQELVALVKANPGKYNYAYPATAVRISGEMFKQRAGGLDILGVPYKGAAPAMQDLFGGRIHIYPGLSGSLVAHHKQGMLRILAVMGEQRLKALPDVPTAIEAGVPGLVVHDFHILCTTAGTPAPIVDQLYQATHRVLNDPAFIKAQEDHGMQPITDSTPEKAREFIIRETARFAPFLEEIRRKS